MSEPEKNPIAEVVDAVRPTFRAAVERLRTEDEPAVIYRLRAPSPESPEPALSESTQPKTTGEEQ